MLTDGNPIVYWDACVMLSYINEIADRLPSIEGKMQEVAAKHEIHLATSVLSIVEVAFAKVEQDKKATDPEKERQIAALWQVGSPIELIEYFEEIGEKAKRLMRRAIEKGWKLTPLDAIHLATADHLHVKRFETYDGGLEKYKELTETGFDIGPVIANQPALGFISETKVEGKNEEQSAGEKAKAVEDTAAVQGTGNRHPESEPAEKEPEPVNAEDAQQTAKPAEVGGPHEDGSKL